jgi:hypothetical protein
MRRALGLCLGMTLVTACSSLKYLPVTSRAGSGGGATAELRRIDVSLDESIVPQLDFRAAEGTKIGTATWHSIDAAPCSKGTEAKLMRIDEHVRWQEQPVDIAGSHRLALQFASDGIWNSRTLFGPSALDLEIITTDGPHCLRLPVAGPEPEMAFELENHWSWAYGLLYQGSTRAVGGLSGRFVFPLSFSRWMGPVRVGVMSGFGLTSCGSSVCPPPVDQKTNPVAPLLPMAIEAEWIAVQSGSFALGAELRYQADLAWPNTYQGIETRFLHGPEGALHFMLTMPPVGRPGFPMGPRVLTVGFEIPVGLWLDATTGERSILIGGALTGSYWM